MTVTEIYREVASAVGWGQNITQKKSILARKLKVVLEEMDPMANWRCAIEDFSKSIPVNKNKAPVSSVNLFKPIICRFVDSDSKEWVLTYRAMTNFEIEDAKYGTDTNDSPTIYTIGGGNIYIGPGVMAVRTSITGKVQRRLTPNDVEQLPGNMIIDGMVMRTASDQETRTNARISFLTNKKEIVAAAEKRTSEDRDTQPIDPAIARNMAYLATL